MSIPPRLAGAPLPAFAGFDTSIYRGDASMVAWKASSPYVFAVYYLKAPCHHSGSWMGHRGKLVDMGWNLLPIYVGQQVTGVSRCLSSVLTVAQGTADAIDAVSKMASEGFPLGSFVYLDVERCDTVPARMTAYITAWISELTKSHFSPGVYCHKHNAEAVRAAVLAGFPVPPNVNPRFWIVGGVTAKFNIATSKPTDVGVSFANLWQCPASVNRTFGNVTINIDENVAQWADPAGPAEWSV